MTIRCTTEQLAEAVTLWSVQVRVTPVLCKELEKVSNLKPLDLILSTINIFKDGFNGKFRTAFDKHKLQFLFSKNKFIDYLKPRCLLLAKKNECFDLCMVCAFVSDALYSVYREIKCIHLSGVTCSLLEEVLQTKFADIFNTDSDWEKLMSYCKSIHYAVMSSEENRPPDSCAEPVSTDEISESNLLLLQQEIESCGVDQTGKLRKQPVSGELDETLINYPVMEETSETDLSGEGQDARSLGQPVSNELEEENLSDYSVLEEATESDSSGDHQDARFPGKPVSNKLEEENLDDYIVMEEATESDSSGECQGVSFPEGTISNQTEEKSISYPVMEVATESENSDDEAVTPDSDDGTSSSYNDMNETTICKRISDSPEHLTDVRNLLRVLRRKFKLETITTPSSDDEDMEKIEVKVIYLDESELEDSENDVHVPSKRIRLENIEESCDLPQNEIFSEDKPDETESRDLNEDWTYSEDKPQCDECYDKKHEYKTKWLQSFQDKYSNCGCLSDYLTVCKI